MARDRLGCPVVSLAQDGRSWRILAAARGPGWGVKHGAEVWRFHPPFDIVVSEAAQADLPAAVRLHLDMYAHRSVDLGGQLVLSGDNAKYLNHSDDPSLEELPIRSIARR